VRAQAIIGETVLFLVCLYGCYSYSTCSLFDKLPVRAIIVVSKAMQCRIDPSSSCRHTIMSMVIQESIEKGHGTI
jgi:hypothetical protein